MVITTSDSFTASVVRILGTSADMSMPASAMASTAAGFTLSAGWDPAERTSIAPFDSVVRNAAAIWDRPALWTQTKRTEGFAVMRAPFGWPLPRTWQWLGQVSGTEGGPGRTRRRRRGAGPG